MQKNKTRRKLLAVLAVTLIVMGLLIGKVSADYALPWDDGNGIYYNQADFGVDYTKTVDGHGRIYIWQAGKNLQDTWQQWSIGRHAAMTAWTDNYMEDNSLKNSAGVSLRRYANATKDADGNYDGYYRTKSGRYVYDYYGSFFQQLFNKDIYCAQQGQTLTRNGVWELKYKIKIGIDGTTKEPKITEAIKKGNGEIVDPKYTDANLPYNTTANATRANKILIELVKEGKAHETTRKRTIASVIHQDIYQHAIWQYFDQWRDIVFGTGVIPEITKPGTYKHEDSGTQSGYEHDDNYDAGEEILDEIIRRVDNGMTNYGQPYINREDTQEDRLKTTVDGTYTILGPFNYTFNGNISSIDVSYNQNADYETNKTFGTFVGNTFKSKNMSDITSGNDFYVRIPTANLSAHKKIYLKIKVTNNNVPNETAIYIFTNDTQQTMAYIDQDYISGSAESTEEYIYGIEQSVSIIKKNEADLPVANIIFDIYDGSTYVGSLTTSKEGTTKTIDLEPDKKYTLKERSNSEYGYKNANIASATITNGKITVLSDGTAEFTITNNSVITIKNEPQLGNITIKKVGESGKGLANAEFIIWNGYGYLQLFTSSGSVSSINKNVTISKSNTASASEYKADFSSTERNKATRFVTNSSGEIVINNLEIYSGKGTTYPYTIEEIGNNNYGYRGLVLTNATVSGATKDSVDTDKRQVKISNIGNNSVITIENSEELVNIHLKKQGDNKKDLSDVEFVVKREGNNSSNTGYLRLNSSTGPITTQNSGLDVRKYTIDYVTDINQATRFKTNESGNIVINGLEKYESKGIKYTYKIKEIANSNYGYNGMILESTTDTKEAKITDDIKNREITIKNSEDDVELTINNKSALGNLELIKVDEDSPSIVLEGVQFKVTKDGKYLQLKNNKDEVQSTVKGTVTINKNNQANNTEYKVEYINDASKATIFETGADGKITINNLEVYSGVNSAQNPIQCTYVFEEVANPIYGYVIGPNISVTIKPDVLNKITATNKQKYIKLTGYAWLEKQNIDKDKKYNLRYIEGTGSVDKKLKDLYKYEGGKLVINPEAEIPVQIKLIQKSTGAEIKSSPDEFDSDGKYTFTNVETDNLADYEIQFVYNGFYYTTINAIIFENDGSIAENTSKVAEDARDRADLNNKFGEINKEGMTSVDGKNNYAVSYEKVENQSYLKGFDFSTNVRATTTLAGYDMNTIYRDLKQKGLTDSINYINLGILEKDQPSISISSDINNVLVNFEGKSYNYDYELRREYRERHSEEEVGVKFEEKKVTRYTRTMYASDIEAIAKDEHKPIEVLITYKITISNLSSTLEGKTSTLRVNPIQLKNYFDNRYTVVAVSHKFDNNQASKTEENYATTELENTTATVDGSSDTVDFKTIAIDYNTWLNPGEVDSLYITFDVERQAIVDLLDEKSTYHNATEIAKYKTAYGDTTGKQDNNYIITDHTEAGSIYAGINAGCAPDNIELKLKDHESGDGTKIFETSGYELDTTSSPSLVLEASDTARQLAGSIWEDTDDNTSDNERLGNGKIDTNEKPIADVVVTLHKVNEDGTISKEPAMYSDGITKAETRTDQQGRYVFGYVKEEAGNREYIGVLPGNYVVKYTYNGESYIHDAATGNNTYIDANYYKSTIITSTVIENAIENEDITYEGVTYPTRRWYLIKEADRYSDAIDNMDLRKDLNNNPVTNKTYNEKSTIITSMDAYTPVMDIGIEYTKDDSAEAVQLDNAGEVEIITFVANWENVDFGIIKRPIIDITIEKEITGMQIVAQNGGNIVPKGNPQDGGMRYIKAVGKLVSGEIDLKLLQGAKLNEEYTVTVDNNCEDDYLTDGYYIYGRDKNTPRDSKAILVVDYLDSTMLLDTEQDNSAWEEKDVQYLVDNGLIEEGGDVHRDLQSGDYRIYVTQEFETKDEIKLYTTRYLATTTNDIVEENRVEIVELNGGRTIERSVPGNYIPKESNPDDPGEPDDSSVKLIITPPTGSTVNNVPYLIAATVTFTILVLGIVVIKKRIVK